MIKLNGFEVKPTIFPDKTSQVWKVDDKHISAFNSIEWKFESEGEIMHVAQLKKLIQAMYPNAQISLHLPYLPYGRQDKDVSNSSTFALRVFADVINSLCFSSVSIVDPHSSRATDWINNSTAIAPTLNIIKLLSETNTISCFPDKGAASRYGGITSQCGSVTFDKVRDQLTGDILGIHTDDIIRDKDYLIIDDICDGGRTFIEVAKALYAGGAKEVNLYVSHGIFSKGLEVLRESGIKRIFTYQGEV